MHSAEGGSLCLLTACREGQSRLGAHLHPTIVTSAIPMGLSMPLWEANDFDGVGQWLRRGVEQVTAAGADFYICPDNTAHIALEPIAESLPIPGLHIADVVCHAIKAQGLRAAALLGTQWTMTGPVYARALERHGIARLVPGAAEQQEINRAIFDELCLGKFLSSTTERFVQVIAELKTRGAECVILGCTEIPLIITQENSPLPVLDSTRLLARYAVSVAIDPVPLNSTGGWLAMGANYP